MGLQQPLALTGILTLTLALGITQDPAQAQSTSLTISVAASLQDAIREIQPLYQQQTPNVELIFNFGSSGSLQRQIEQGAPVDVFISAAARQMDALEQQDLILVETRTDLVVNRLVLITPETGSSIENPEDLIQPEISQVAMGEPTSVPAGNYAQQALTSLGLFRDLEPKLIFGKDVPQVLNYVETGNVEAGIVYQTDALLSERTDVAYLFPADTHDPIVYPIAVIKESDDLMSAQDFVNFMQGEDAQEVLVEFGFSRP